MYLENGQFTGYYTRKKINDKCGVFGLYDPESSIVEPAKTTYYGLFALQHRGQESSGIASSNGQRIVCYADQGLVPQVYSKDVFARLNGGISIGHNRYSTSGSKEGNFQPIVDGGLLALAHNGNIPHPWQMINFLRDKSVPVIGMNDSQLMHQTLNYYLEKGASLEEAVEKSTPLFKGAYSLLLMTKDKLAAVRDKHGVRPLAMGRLNGGFVFSSETCALNNVAAEFVKEVNPGEMIVASKGELKSYQLESSDPRYCAYEFFYLARPDSILAGQMVYSVRKNLGKILAQESPVDADVVFGIPQSGIPSAIGYSQDSGIQYDEGFMKNQYIGRTFIEPDERTRSLGVRIKLNPIADVVDGKKVVAIDDSMVRANSSGQYVGMLRSYGAREVHVRISSPPIKHGNVLGIDTPTTGELIASKMTQKEIKEFIGADSLEFISLDGFVRATKIPEENLELSCFTGKLRVDVNEPALVAS